jgi:ribosomal protein S4E
VGKGGVPYIATHDGRTIRYPDPDIRVRRCFCSRPPAVQHPACTLHA